MTNINQEASLMVVVVEYFYRQIAHICTRIISHIGNWMPMQGNANVVVESLPPQGVDITVDLVGYYAVMIARSTRRYYWGNIIRKG